MKKTYESRFLTSFIRIIIIIFAILTTEVNAQNDYSIPETDSIILKTHKLLPIINNFRFIPSDIVNDPFITTYVKTSVGAGMAFDLKSYVKNLQGNIIDTLSGKLSFISADIQFQYALNDWLAINASYGGAGRLGNNAYTLLTSGISYTTGFTLGGKIKLWQNNEMILSGSVDYKSNDIFLYSIYNFVKRVVESGSIDSLSRESLLEKDKINSTFLNLIYAFAPSDWFGILANAGWGSANTFQTKSRGNLRFGLATSIDFNNIKYVSFPVGLLLSIKYNKFPESGENASNILIYGIRIGYTGHKDFDIGLENTYQSLNYKLSDDKIKTLLTSFKLRYYF